MLPLQGVVSVALLMPFLAAVGLPSHGPAQNSARQERSPSTEALLRRADIGGFAPESFRARLTFAQPAQDDRHEIELWRSGADRTLVRMLDPKEVGKYLLRLGTDLWFLAPGAREPVKLSPTHRIYGAATIDLLMGLRLSEHYRIVDSRTERSDGVDLVVFELEAVSEGLQFARVRYAVRADTARPVMALYSVRSGREAVRMDFRDWSASGGHHASRIEVRDRLRNDALTTIDIVEFEERAVPSGLFDLRDDTARAALEGGFSPTGS